MQVTLRIVGLFFNKKVIIPDEATNTVKDVMDAYRGTTRGKTSDPEGLTYAPNDSTNPNLTIKKISYNFNGRYDFEGDSPATGDDVRSLAGRDIPPRVYSLSERKLGTKSQLGWQYYVIDRNGNNKSKTLQAQGFTSFGDNSPRKTYTIEDGDTIIWRLLAINNVYEYPTY